MGISLGASPIAAAYLGNQALSKIYLGASEVFSAGGFDPIEYFSAGEQGFIYDIQDLSTLFQDTADTIPAVVGLPVARILDKSGNGNHATQATSTKRPILKQDASGRAYLLFDGVDDALATGSIDFTGTDKMTVWAGVRKLSDAVAGVVVELSEVSNTNNGSFKLLAPGSDGIASVAESSRGTAVNASNQNVVATGLTAPVTVVAAGSHSISGDLVSLRVNGALAGTATGDQGAGNFGNYPLYIGSRGGTSLPFNGHIYSLIVRGAQSTTDQITQTETWVNDRTGAYA